MFNTIDEAHLAELRETRAGIAARMKALHNQAQAMLGRAKAAGRDITTAEQQKVDAALDGFEAHERELRVIDAEIASAEAELADSTPRGRIAAPNPIGGRMGGRAVTHHAPIALDAPRTIKNIFGEQVPSDPYYGRFGSLGEFARAVALGNDGRLIRNEAMTEGTGADGGFAVPIQFLGPILDAALQLEVVRPRANVVPIASKQALASTFDYADGTSAKRGGLQLLWGSEASALPEQKGKLREIQLNAHKGSIFVRVSNELAADAPSFDRQLEAAMVRAVAAGLDLAFIAGTGVGQPLGILNAPATITVAKEGGQAANTLLLQNLANMLGRLAPSSFARSAWLLNPTVVPLLYQLAVVVKNVAGTENVGGSTAAAVTVDADGQLRIFGRPVGVTDACPVLSAAGDVMLVDLSQYIVGLRADATLRRDESRYFDSDELAFRLTIRVDGQPADAAATKLRDGTNTVSPFVALGAR